MGWLELLTWLKVMRRQTSAKKVSPDSWKNVDQDEWWVKARRERDEQRRRERGF